MQSIANCEPYSNMRTLGKLLEISNNNNKPAWASLYHKLESLRWHIYTGHVMSWLAPHGIGGVLFYFTRIQIFCQVFAILCCNLFQIFSLYSLATLGCNLFRVDMKKVQFGEKPQTAFEKVWWKIEKYVKCTFNTIQQFSTVCSVNMSV
jgi:hypothetical protein